MSQWEIKVRMFSAEKKCLCSAAHLSVTEWHWVMIQRNTEAGQDSHTVAEIAKVELLIRGNRTIKEERRLLGCYAV
jgi:DTW domain-containing protein YfiP